MFATTGTVLEHRYGYECQTSNSKGKPLSMLSGANVDAKTECECECECECVASASAICKATFVTHPENTITRIRTNPVQRSADTNVGANANAS